MFKPSSQTNFTHKASDSRASFIGWLKIIIAFHAETMPV